MDNPNLPETNYQPPEKPPVKMYIYPTGGRELNCQPGDLLEYTDEPEDQ